MKVLRSSGWRVLAAGLAIAAFAGFIALGNWQLERREWKLALIERVTARAAAEPQAAPLPSHWPTITQATHEYVALKLSGTFLDEHTVKVATGTELGSGYWVLTPLKTEHHGTVLINRGYVGQGVVPSAAPQAAVTVQGLLRLPEPEGGLFRANQPEADRWYSRDVSGIAQSRQLELAPYFVDAFAGEPGSPGMSQQEGYDGRDPVGGLTVIQFKNTHLIYAITWYGLALMVAGAVAIVWRESRKGS